MKVILYLYFIKMKIILHFKKNYTLFGNLSVATLRAALSNSNANACMPNREAVCTNITLFYRSVHVLYTGILSSLQDTYSYLMIYDIEYRYWICLLVILFIYNACIYIHSILLMLMMFTFVIYKYVLIPYSTNCEPIVIFKFLFIEIS